MYRISAQSSGLRAQKKGFTLVELIVVMSVVAIMATVTITISVTGNLQKGRDRRRETDLEAIKSVLEIYRSDNGTYPPTANWKTLLSPTYMATIPADPKSGADYIYTLGPVSCNTLNSAYCLCTNDREIIVPNPTYCVANP